MRQPVDHAFLQMQKFLPKHLLTSIVHWLAGIRISVVKNFLIRAFVHWFEVDTSIVAHPVPDGFRDFNAFFVRELADGARPVDGMANTVVSPVDGTLSACGAIDGNTIFQAKGLNYTLGDLLSTNLQDAAEFENGAFATIYLAPYNYHRVHSPFAGTVVAAHYVPGDLFSVNHATVSLLPRLFTRNERLVCHFETAFGKMVLVFVGALNVGSISTPWTGEIRPRKTGVVRQMELRQAKISTAVDKGDLLGWFNMGSTVILLMPPATCQWRKDLAGGRAVRMGEVLGLTMTGES